MNAEMKNYVIKLLETYHDRERMIAVLRYDLEHPAKVNSSEQIEAMNYRRGDDIGNVKGHISNKTLYIALNYEEQAGRLNAEAAREVADELFGLEQQQKKLLYYPLQGTATVRKIEDLAEMYACSDRNKR